MEEELRLRELLFEVFGESDGSESEDDPDPDQDQWKPVEFVKGLWTCPGFLSASDEQEMLLNIESEAWFKNPEENQAMSFGELPLWALKLSALIYSSVESYRQLNTREEAPLPPEILSRVPLFNQMIVNKYQPLEGIHAHVDLLRFEDGIGILSLLSPRVMTFRHLKSGQEVRVLLMPGDLLLMVNEARYEWSHEINSEHQVWNGVKLEQGKRVSVTIRRLCRQE